MDRRTYLAALPITALFAGCGSLSEGRNRTAPTDRTEASPDEGIEDGSPKPDDSVEEFWQPQETFERRHEPTVVEFETAPYTAAVVRGWFGTADDFSVTLDFEYGATAESPATLIATVANTRPYEQTVDLRRLLVLDDPPVGRNGDRTVAYLAPTENHPLAETTPEAGRDDGQWRVDTVAPDWFPRTVTFPAESGFVAEYSLLGHHDQTEPPLGPGQYEFTWRDNSFAIALWRTDEPGPTRDSTFAGEVVPPLDDEIAWYHEATPTTEVYLELDAEAVEPPAKISFDLVNHSHELVRGNPYYWRLHKQVGGDWVPVEPWQWPQPLATVGPGGSDETTLALFAGSPVSCEGVRTVGHLGGGRYAYEVGYSRDEETHAALLAFDAPALSVGIEDDAEILEEDETVVVELPNHVDARRPAVFEATRANGEPERQLIPEQLPRRPFRAPRNSFPLFDEGVETVRVRTDRGTALRMLGYEEETTRTVGYEEEVYQVRGELLGE